MKAYTVEYRLFRWSHVRSIVVFAKTKKEAHDKATFELIPSTQGEIPYSSWVYSVTYNNENYRRFNNFEGNPY